MKLLFAVFTGLLILICAVSTQAQNVRTLTLNESIAIALDKSYTIKTEKQNYLQYQYLLRASQLSLKSKVDFDLYSPDFSKSVRSEFNTTTRVDEYFDSQNMEYRGLLSISQPIKWTNGQFYIESTITKADQISWTDDIKSSEKDDFTKNIGIRFVQPLFQPNQLKISGRQVELNFESAELNYTQRQLQIIYNVTSSFYNLYKASREVDIAKDEVQRQQHSYNLAMNKYKAGIIAEVDALQQEVDLANSKNSLSVNEGSLKRLKDQFKLLIGLDLSESINIVTNIEYKPIIVNLDKAISEALKRRPEIRNAEISKELQEYTVENKKAERKIKANIRASLYLNDIQSDLTLYQQNPMTGQTIESLINNDQNLQSNSVYLNLSVPIWDWGKHKQEVQASLAELKTRELAIDYRKDEIIQEIKEVVSKVEEAKERLEILKKSEQLAQKTYDISLERFNNGDITSEDLALQQNRLTTAKTSYLNALVDYLVSVSDLKRKTYWDFEKDKPLGLPEKPKM